MDVFLGRSVLGVYQLDKPARWFDVSNAFEGWDRAKQEIESMGGKHTAKVRTRVWLSGSVARPFLLPILPGLTRAHDALKVAQTMCAEATGLAGPCRLWLDDWVKDQACLAVAMEQSVVDAIEASAGKAKFVLEGLRPWWSEALRASLNLVDRSLRPSLLAIDDGEALTVLGGSKQGFANAVGYGHATAEQIASIVSRTMLIGEQESVRTVLVRRHKSDDEAALSKGNKLEVVFGADWELMK
jgi:hypothetical protein